MGLKYIGVEDGSSDDYENQSEGTVDEDEDGIDDILTENVPQEKNTCNFDEPTSTLSTSNYITVIKYCHTPCGTTFTKDDPMCIRTCLCPKNHVVTKDGGCKLLNATMIAKLNKILTKNVNKTWNGGIENWSTENRSQRDEGKITQCFVLIIIDKELRVNAM